MSDSEDAPLVTDNFTMDCPRCGPDTVHFLNGEMVPHGCNYEPPSLIVDYERP